MINIGNSVFFSCKILNSILFPKLLLGIKKKPFFYGFLKFLLPISEIHLISLKFTFNILYFLDRNFAYSFFVEVQFDAIFELFPINIYVYWYKIWWVLNDVYTTWFGFNSKTEFSSPLLWFIRLGFFYK